MTLRRAVQESGVSKSLTGVNSRENGRRGIGGSEYR